MVEPTGHCPYVGLKQNRAIRFASPTPEHRCYVSGEPLEIPVDQAGYCLSQDHVHCPLYMGLTVPTTSDVIATGAGAVAALPAAGVRGWYATLSPRDRVVYAIMLAMLALIVAIYLFVGLQSFLARGGAGGLSNLPTAVLATQQPAIGQNPTAQPTEIRPTDMPPTPTDLPTNTPAAQPTDAPTQAPIILQPTQAPTSAPSPASAPSPTSATQAPTQAPTSAPSPTSRPAAPSPTSATQAPTQAPTSTPRPTSRPPVPSPTSAPRPTNTPQPTAPPVVAVTTRAVTLYFIDPTGSVIVPVRRNTNVESNRVAEAAVRELIAGPRNGLGRQLRADTNLLGVTINNGLATVNFDRDPGNAETIILTLTEFSSVSRVQLQVNGANLGAARGRPVLNPLNPQRLAVDYGTTEFLPLYFPSASGAYDIRLIRMVPKTKQTAEATLRALLEGPGEYGSAVRRVIPEGTELRGLKLNKGVVLVDFTQPFASAGDLGAAMRTVVESLTTLPGVGGVQFLVEGQAFADGKVFPKPAINQE